MPPIHAPACNRRAIGCHHLQAQLHRQARTPLGNFGADQLWIDIERPSVTSADSKHTSVEISPTCVTRACMACGKAATTGAKPRAFSRVRRSSVESGGMQAPVSVPLSTWLGQVSAARIGNCLRQGFSWTFFHPKQLAKNPLQLARCRKPWVTSVRTASRSPGSSPARSAARIIR